METITVHAVNELRFNSSLSRVDGFFALDNFGGAVPPSSLALFPTGQSLSSSSFTFLGDLNPFGLSFEVGKFANNLQHQINVTDSLSWMVSSHQLKLGIDSRRLNPEQKSSTYQQVFDFGTLASVLANSVTQVAVSSRTADVQLVTYNWSLFAQDTWRVAPHLTVTYGTRWEYNTAPSSPNGTPPFTVTQVSDLATLALAPVGTALWHPQKDDFAPRLGLAWQVRANLAIRSGAGIFYDLGYADVANALISFPYVQQKTLFGSSFPLTGDSAIPPPFTTSPPVPSISVVDPNHVLPRTYEWNAAVEQSFGKADVLSLTYVGAAGRRLMRRDIYIAPNRTFTYRVDVQSNAGISNYNSLQAQFRHRLSHGLQALLSYTWGHSIDDVSSDGNFQNVPADGSSSIE